ncbi:MAG: hypothetical protein V3T23_01865 [Nitrososphaerales archaeon]
MKTLSPSNIITAGWMKKGPQWVQGSELGWFVYANKEEPDMVPVFIVKRKEK